MSLSASLICLVSPNSPFSSYPRLPSKIYHGITTEIAGEGECIAPLNDIIND